MNSFEFAQYQQESRRLLAARGELTARGELRPTTTADASRRLASIRAEQTAERRQRLARLTTEVAPPSTTPPSVGLRIDPQGRVRLICWEVGQVVVRPARKVTQ